MFVKCCTKTGASHTEATNAFFRNGQEYNTAMMPIFREEGKDNGALNDIRNIEDPATLALLHHTATIAKTSVDCVAVGYMTIKEWRELFIGDRNITYRRQYLHAAAQWLLYKIDLDHHMEAFMDTTQTTRLLENQLSVYLTVVQNQMNHVSNDNNQYKYNTNMNV